MFRKIFKYASEFKKESILAPIFISIEVIMETLIPLVIAALIDKGVNQNDLHNGQGKAWESGYTTSAGPRPGRKRPGTEFLEIPLRFYGEDTSRIRR